ncbi:MAG: AmmeMemoRadiSam system radical SAM enzyme [Synergistaceae bacterium]|nr:AmmeMemoRadiSam system radical SAM enzyme [Synergistaceae bacterium]
MSRAEEGITPALWWNREDGAIRCTLCPHRCLIQPGQKGFCGVRQASADGEFLFALNAGLAASLHLDPVEKKPLFHWYPGSRILSIGTVGCNLACPFCQNWELARWNPEVGLTGVTPQDLLKSARESGSRGVAFTYNEPLVWYEFLIEASRLLRKEGFDVVLVTNGTINPEPLGELLPFISAANVDLKAFTETAYRKLGGFLQPVLETIRSLKKARVHVELTHLLVPGINLERPSFEAMVDWIRELDETIPLHISRYFPRWKWTEPATSPAVMEEFRQTAAARLPYVYTGNVPDLGITRCRKCGRDIVVRNGYNVVQLELDPFGKCRFCGQENGFVVRR